MNAELNRIVQRIIDDLVASGEEIGLQVAAYVDGELAVDCWAGLADRAAGRKVDGDTLFMVCSAAKGVTSTCLHLLAERGLVDYDAPVARYWPEFAAHGKEGITIRHVLTHTAGVPQMPDGVTPEMTWDWEAMCAAIADATPLWEPGATACYHALTFGWLVGEVVRRVDGRPIAQYCREALCAPLGACDIYLTVPEEVDSRVATVEVEPFPADGPPWAPVLLRALPLDMTRAETFNRPAGRRASVSARGTMSARGLARHYAMLAERGELDGVRLLSPGRIDAIRALQTDARDAALGGRVRRGLGYMLGGAIESGGNLVLGASEGAFGHPGFGGSAGFADPERRLGFALAKTYLRVAVAPKQGAAYRVAQAIRDYLAAAR